MLPDIYKNKYQAQLEYSKLISDKELISQFDYLARMYPYESSRYVGNIVWSFKRNTAKIPVSWFGDGVQLEFEGRNYRCPNEYDKILTQIYGDWRLIPTEPESHDYCVYEKD